ncbi:homocysteine S-methyltransferase, partial [Obelidium mucronatum]
MVHLLDGGLATHLEELGADLGCDPLWNARLLLSKEGRELIERAHLDYLSAGCDILTTASYQAFVPTADVPSTVSADIDLPSLFPLAMKVVRDAVEKSGRKSVRVAASMGSYGAVLANGAEYTGDFGGISWNSLVVFHQTRIETILKTQPETWPDLLAFETIPSIFESTAIVEALEQCSRSKEIPPAWISFSNTSESRECAASVKGSTNIFAVGVNCVKPELVEPILRIYKEELAESGKELLCYPNKGETWDAIGRGWVQESGVQSEEAYVNMAKTWISAGASIVGGCCPYWTEALDVSQIDMALLHRIRIEIKHSNSILILIVAPLVPPFTMHFLFST